MTILTCCGTCHKCELTLDERVHVCPDPWADDDITFELAEIADRDAIAREALAAAGLAPAF